MNARLLRQLLTFAEDNPGLIDNRVWGEVRDSGNVTDLGGRALLLSGWTLVEDNTFASPDGSREIGQWPDIEREARGVLGLTEDEFWGGGDMDSLFDLGYDDGLKRLQELTGQAEAAVANG